ncbi:MAG: hypothetical protein DRQ42_06835 [Gammaproteobacteria bacterium]|nr:MAG: hypothetical protein DRQ42_06835 [Gammaproteobacteria bacterium]
MAITIENKDLANSDYLNNADKWLLIDDVYSDEVIADKDTFNRNIVLPYSGKSSDNVDVNAAIAKLQDDFFKGADFTNVLARTVNVMVGAVKINESDLALNGLDEKMRVKELITDIKNSLFNNVLYSRCGLLVSAPESDTELTVEDIKNGEGARINVYEAWQIMDWNTDDTGKILYVVLAEPSVTKSVDNLGESGYQMTYRVIFRDESNYIWIRILDEELNLLDESPVINADGTHSEEFPFKFVGAFVNTPDINKPAFYAMAKKNIILLSYSAHANQSMRQFGAPILYIAPSETLEDSFGSQITAGGLTGYNVGAGGTVAFAQPAANTLATQGKKEHIDELIKMGARLITDSAANQTAEAAYIQHSGDMSMLQSCINNISMAWTEALRLLADYSGITYSTDTTASDYIGLSINEELVNKKADATMLQALISGVSMSTLPMQSLYEYVKDVGLIDEAMDFEEYQAELNEMVFSTTPEPVAAPEIEE